MLAGEGSSDFTSGDDLSASESSEPAGESHWLRSYSETASGERNAVLSFSTGGCAEVPTMGSSGSTMPWATSQSVRH